MLRLSQHECTKARSHTMTNMIASSAKESVSSSDRLAEGLGSNPLGSTGIEQGLKIGLTIIDGLHALFHG